MIRLHKIFCLTILSLSVVYGCNSQEANLKRISKRAPFILQLGFITQLLPGENRGTDACEDIAIDKDENIICVGYTNGNIAKINPAPGTQDPLVVKLNKYGELLWVFQLNVLGGNNCSGLAIDNEDNIYCAGVSTTLIADTLSHGVGGENDGIILKLNPSGELQWIRQFGSAANDECHTLTISRTGNLYCAGDTYGDLGQRIDGNGTETQAGLGDMFITKFDSNGNFKWLTQTGTQSRAKWSDGNSAVANRFEVCNGVAVDSQENYVYCSGVTNSSMGEPNVTSDEDVVFLRVNASDGKNPKAIQHGDYGGAATAGNEYCRRMTIDAQGNLYCAGFTDGSFGDVISGPGDAIIVKINSDFTKGPVWQFGLSFQLGDSSGSERCLTVVTDYLGNVFCTGITNSNFGEVHGGGTQDAFIIKVSPSGTPQWVRQFGAISMAGIGDSLGNDQCYGIAMDKDQNVYCAGFTYSNLGESNSDFPASTSGDIFIARTRADGTFP